MAKDWKQVAKAQKRDMAEMKATPAPAPVKVERVSNEVTPLSDDPLDIPDFLRIKSTKTEE